MALLNIAKCPQCDGSGAYYQSCPEDEIGDSAVLCQCQWCDEVKQLIKEIEEEQAEIA